MCGTCGCGGEGYRIDGHAHSGDDHSGHAHSGDNQRHADFHARDRLVAADPGSRTVLIQERVLARNDELAQRNREWLAQHGVLAVNLMSSPGSGKTTLLERSARDLAGRPGLFIIEGDQETDLDGGRMRAAGCQVVQINTGAGCHLDAAMVGVALGELDPPPGSVVVIENVGNLVCPALFDLGEAARVVLASVTEGADKPVKYPTMFRRADLVLITKTDLLRYLDFDLARCRSGVRQASPGARLLEVSAVTGSGMASWYEWLEEQLRSVPRGPQSEPTGRVSR